MLQACAKVFLKRKRPENVLTRDMEWICRLDTSPVQVCPDAAISLWDHELRPTPVSCSTILIPLYELRSIKKADFEYPTGATPQIDENSGRIVDWGFRSYEQDGALGGGVTRWYYWWNESHQEHFNRLWSPEGNRTADDLAELYGASWPWLIGEALATTAPATYEQLVDLSVSLNSSRSERLHARSPESIADGVLSRLCDRGDTARACGCGLYSEFFSSCDLKSRSSSIGRMKRTRTSSHRGNTPHLGPPPPGG
jgi:hypothetical protein